MRLGAGLSEFNRVIARGSSYQRQVTTPIDNATIFPSSAVTVYYATTHSFKQYVLRTSQSQ